MEKEFEGKIKFLQERSKSSKKIEESYLEEELEEEHVKEILRDVLNELYYSKKSKTQK